MLSTRDRLKELQQVRRDNNAGKRETLLEIDEENDEITEIYRKFQYVRSLIDCIKEDTNVMKTLFSQATFHTSRAMQSKMDSLLSSSTEMVKQVALKIRELEDDIDFSDESLSNENRIKQVQYLTIRKLYEEAMLENSNFLEKYREKQLAIIKEQAKLTKQSLTSEELNNICHQNQSLFTDNLIAETIEERQLLSDLQNRHKELIKIENCIKEMRDAFVELGTIVYNQQNIIDRVEYYATQATGNVDHGRDQLSTANMRKKKKRTYKIMIFGTLSLLLVVSICILF